MKRGGFAIPLALAIMVALSILSVTSLQVALVDFQANRGGRLAVRALYAAESGAQHTLATWSTGPWAALGPGDSASTAWTDLPDGSHYQSVVLRVDDGSGSPLYRVLTEGRPSASSTARRQLLTMVTGAAGGGTLRREAAAVMRGRVQLRGEGGGGRGRGRGGGGEPPLVDGRDHVPSAWAGSCPTPTSGVGGVMVERERDLRLLRDAEVAGTPPVTEAGRLGSDVVDALAGTGFDALAANADVRFTRNTRLRGEVRPRARGGTCDTSRPDNWGAPEQPGSACWGYLPTIHVDGNLRIDRGGVGQGMLLVDGNLVVRGEFRFYGLVVVTGRLILRDESVLTGSVVVAGGRNGNGISQLRDGARIRYSSCSVARASAGLGGARFLSGRHWFELP